MNKRALPATKMIVFPRKEIGRSFERTNLITSLLNKCFVIKVGLERNYEPHIIFGFMSFGTHIHGSPGGSSMSQYILPCLPVSCTSTFLPPSLQGCLSPPHRKTGHTEHATSFTVIWTTSFYPRTTEEPFTNIINFA